MAFLNIFNAMAIPASSKVCKIIAFSEIIAGRTFFFFLHSSAFCIFYAFSVFLLVLKRRQKPNETAKKTRRNSEKNVRKDLLKLVETETAKTLGNGDISTNRRYLLLFQISSNNFTQVEDPGMGRIMFADFLFFVLFACINFSFCCLSRFSMFNQLIVCLLSVETFNCLVTSGSNDFQARLGLLCRLGRHCAGEPGGPVQHRGHGKTVTVSHGP